MWLLGHQKVQALLALRHPVDLDKSSVSPGKAVPACNEDSHKLLPTFPGFGMNFGGSPRGSGCSFTANVCSHLRCPLGVST